MWLEASYSDFLLAVAVLTCLLLRALFVADSSWGGFLWEYCSGIIRPALFPKIQTANRRSVYIRFVSGPQPCLLATDYVYGVCFQYAPDFKTWMTYLGNLNSNSLLFKYSNILNSNIQILAACLHSDPLPIRRELITHMLFN